MSSGRVRVNRKPKEEFPALPLSCSVVYPQDVVSIQLPDDDVLRAVIDRGDEDPVVATVFPHQEPDGPPELDDLQPVAVLCRVVQTMQLPGGGTQAVFQGLARARLDGVRHDGEIAWVQTERLDESDDPDSPESNRRVLDVLDRLGEFLSRDGSYPDDLEGVLRMNVRGPGRFADLVAAHLHLPLMVKREVAIAGDVRVRLDLLAVALDAELARQAVETDVHQRVREQIEERQREQYLRQQMKAIRAELGDETSPEAECEDLTAKLRAARLPKDARETAEREIRRLRSVSPSSAEYQVIRTYVGWLLDLPWRKRSRDRLDLKRAKKELDAGHSGLERVKERILEHLAVRKLNKKQRGPILCLVGPPGVGKTTLGKSVAKALGRKFVRMSVGGLRDEAEIKGHRRTYVGAMPGKVLQLMKHAGTRNPVLQIDEIDKMGSDHRGDPSSAVLEVLDRECNTEFRDHYLDVGYDLSDVFFLVTANLLDTIPPALKDRLEIVRLGGYTREEKLTIARAHLVPKAVATAGLEGRDVRFTPAGLGQIIDGHTREAGLREFERALSAVCRKVARRRVEGDTAPVSVGKRVVHELLGPAPYRPPLAGRAAEVGTATGLAWTRYGGTLLTIEATRMPGKGEIKVTGQLGDVMQESAQAALSYVRAHADEFEIDTAAFRESDLHIHFPEGATPKDGPSAGVAIATCLASLFTRRAVRHDLAMTGEITLKGRVLEVGGIKEKLLAAHRAGIRRVVIPKDNLKDIDEVPEEVQRELEIVPSDDVLTNICEALLHIVVPEGRVLDGVDCDTVPEVARLRSK